MRRALTSKVGTGEISLGWVAPYQGLLASSRKRETKCVFQWNRSDWRCLSYTSDNTPPPLRTAKLRHYSNAAWTSATLTGPTD